MARAIGPLVRLRTRAIYADVAKRETWYSPLLLSAGTLDEIHFWLNNFNFGEGYSFKPMPITTKIMFTDASESGYGGFMMKRAGEVVVVGNFTDSEQQTSSTMRELLAVQYCLQSLTSRLAHESVTINVDNFAASRILTVGSAKPHLQEIAINIFRICLKYNIKLIATWVPSLQLFLQISHNFL